MNASLAPALRAAAAVLGLAATAAVAAPPSDHPAPDMAMHMLRQHAPPEPSRSGRVLSHEDSNEYTYVQVAENGETLWLAAPRTPIADGDTIRYPEGVVMRDFYSKLLKRTFPAVMFVESIEKSDSR